jgi:spore maturation protein CgeB
MKGRPMHFVMFYHSLVSDWNHGNAHFLRGIIRELRNLGHQVSVYEPLGGWSFSRLIEDRGPTAINGFFAAYPGMRPILYRLQALDLDQALADADVVIVHEWNDPALVTRIGRCRARGGKFRLLFHDTHHRSVSSPSTIPAFALESYDGVLAFGEKIREHYIGRGWARRAWTWHEAADTALFRPPARELRYQDLVWIGNWGDGERNAELREFLLDPVRHLGLRARIHGVRYPAEALAALHDAGVEYGGWLPNYLVPQTFARARLTVHIPRRPYAEKLPGIPTIRVFEALACGIPLICSPWEDAEGLFRPGEDYLVAANGSAMAAAMRGVLQDGDLAASLSRKGWETIQARHTCRHRAEELLTICRSLGAGLEKRPGTDTVMEVAS